MKIKNKNRYAWRIFRLNGHFFEIFLLQIIIQEKRTLKKELITTTKSVKKREASSSFESTSIRI